jgi:hypothetical protein|tara:strand:+ start:247 stop:375 length:129 start_codon:yes stop_codon:yes gene_type:complete
MDGAGKTYPCTGVVTGALLQAVDLTPGDLLAISRGFVDAAEA